MKKFIISILSVSILLSVFSAVIFADKVEITLWHMEQPPQRIKGFQNVIDKFNDLNPDIELKQQVIDWSNAYQKSMAAIQAGRAPEILFTLPDFTTTVKKSGAVQPVDDLVKELNEKYGFIDAALKPYTYDGHIWAIPTYGMVQVMWYRKDLFEEVGLDPDNPPKTWKELLEVAEIFKENGINAIGVPTSDHMYTDQALYSFMSTANSRIFDDNGKLIFDSPETVKTFDFYNKLASYSPKDSTIWSWAEPQLALNNGTLAIAIEKGQFLSPFEEQSGLEGSNLGVAPIPQPEWGERASIYYPNGMMIMTDDEEKLAAVKKFVHFLFEPEINGEWYGMDPGLFLPVTEATLESNSYWSNPVIAQYEDAVNLMIEQSKYGKLFGFNSNTVNQNVGKIAGQNILAKTVQQMVVRGLSPEEAVSWGKKEMENIIEE